MRRISRIAAALFAGSLTVLPAAAQTASELYEEGVTARQEQRFDVAIVSLERALALEPGNADALVQLGFARLGAGDTAGARTAFEDALAIAPAYSDATFGLAQIALREGDAERARSLIEPLVAANPDNAEFRDLQTSAAAASASDARRWRLDIGTEASALSGGRSSWTDSAAGLSYRATDRTSVGGRVRHARRSGADDWQVEGRIDHRLTDRIAVHGLAAATPDADFLARSSFGIGGTWRLFDGTSVTGPAIFGIDSRYDTFALANVWTFAPSVQVFTADERFGFTARWIHAEDDRGTVADGFLLRADWTATERLRLFAGYADAPEISDGQLDETETVFGGLAFDVTDRLTLTGSYAHERRETFDRDTFGIGLSLRF
ncbi:YaiO family outer membrane beta-barrel protein [Mesorhizobium sp. YIM 152430]|uniref:YaiO family outer membrane beta-barrel protein n=1 Tax=Mesorhizobium sp. YIM 152430 TaxID=3031761 RepID=UPI0023DBECC2|nr:YaiO family outer membrane beta-barrel protein [Mesorhizobium sp. YIM 152430]MDF1600819.1 YaiO family outer membrane beta-barrel protein [Mesorhizobium sp. YIM 152430]